jgi:acyl transferase domain-containing protein
VTARAVLLFPGQGAQYQGMAVDLYHHHEVFRASMDEVFDLWGAEGAAIRADWLSDDPVLGIDDLRRSQPLLFAVGHALAAAVRAEGVEPVAVLGHSVGEVVAAVVAGVLTLPDAAEMVRERIEHLDDAPSGGLLAVAASMDEVIGLLDDGVNVAAVNAPRQLMLAGLEEPLELTQKRLQAEELTTRRVRAGVPFHSPVLAEHAARSLPSLRALTLSPPALPLYSAYTGALLGDEALRPEFWAYQLIGTVWFAEALDALAASSPGRFVFAEAGSGQLALLGRRHPRISRTIAMLPASARTGAADHFARAVEEIYLAPEPEERTDDDG